MRRSSRISGSKQTSYAEPDDEVDDAPVEKKSKAGSEKKAPVKETKGVLEEGTIVPDFTLKDDADEEISLKDLYEKQGLVIFSYPKASTPGCTTQACLYRDMYDEITATGFAILGLSRDSPKAQLSFKKNKSFQYTLLSDPESKLLGALGATDKLRRNHWIIGKGGKLLEKKLGVTPKTDAENALTFIKNLKEEDSK